MFCHFCRNFFKISSGNKTFAIKDIKSLTIGYFEEFLQSDSIDASIKEQYEAHLKNYESIGMKLEKINIPLLHKAAEIYYIIACAEASSNLARYQGVYFGKSLTKHLENHQSENDYWKDVANYRSAYFGKEVQKRILLGSYVLSSEKSMPCEFFLSAPNRFCGKGIFGCPSPLTCRACVSGSASKASTEIFSSTS